MTHVCPVCLRLLEDGDRVATSVIATYRKIASTRTFAFDKHDLEVTEKLIHEECLSED